MLVRVVVVYLQVMLDVYVGPHGWLFVFLDFYLLRFLGFEIVESLLVVVFCLVSSDQICWLARKAPG